VAEAHLALGDALAAIEWIEECLTIASGTYPYLEAQALLALATARRDTGDATAATNAAEEAGLTVLRCTHFHSWLAPVAWLVRRTPVGRLMGGGSAEEASFGNRWINRALQLVTDVERTVLARYDAPVGLSILLVARVPCAGSLAVEAG